MEKISISLARVVKGTAQKALNDIFCTYRDKPQG